MKTLKESLLDDFGSQTKDLRKKMIEDWLKKNTIYHPVFTINEDLTIDISSYAYDGDGDLPDFIQFRNCAGDFICSYCEMTTLRGCPQHVDGNFNCASNKLKTLEYAPEIVKGSFDCSENELTSLRGCPKKVGLYFDCSKNKLKSLKGCPKKIYGYFDCQHNPLTSLKDGPKEVTGVYYTDFQ